jgi:hypothetical protein
MLDSRHQHIAALLPDGKVLVAGGFGGSGDYGNTSFLPTAELYNPATGTWSATGTMFEARSLSTATRLPNGKILLAGGMNTSVYLVSAVLPTGTELYDPGTGTWSTAGTISAARIHHTATLLSNGKVLVAGGLTGVDNVLSSTELYTPTDIAPSPSGGGGCSVSPTWKSDELSTSGIILTLLSPALILAIRKLILRGYDIE